MHICCDVCTTNKSGGGDDTSVVGHEEKVGGGAERCLAPKQPRDCGELLTHDDSCPTMPGMRATDQRTRRWGTG